MKDAYLKHFDVFADNREKLQQTRPKGYVAIDLSRDRPILTTYATETDVGESYDWFNSESKINYDAEANVSIFRISDIPGKGDLEVRLDDAAPMTVPVRSLHRSHPAFTRLKDGKAGPIVFRGLHN